MSASDPDPVARTPAGKGEKAMTKKQEGQIEKRKLSQSPVKNRKGRSPVSKSKITRGGVFAATFYTGSEAIDKMRDRFESREFWTIIFAREMEGFYEHLVRSYYAAPSSPDDGRPDAAATIITSELLDKLGVAFGVGSLRKSRMLAPAYRREIEQIGLRFEESMLVANDILFLTPPEVGRLLAAPIVRGLFASDISPAWAQTNAPSCVKEMERLYNAGVIARDNAYLVDVAHDAWCAIYKGNPCDCDPDIINHETGEVLNRKERTGEID